MELVTNARNQELAIVSRLVAESSALENDKKAHKVRKALLNAVRDYIENRFPLLVVNDAICHEGEFSNSLDFVILNLECLHKTCPVTADLVKWLMSKVICAAAHPEMKKKHIWQLRKFMKEVGEKYLPRAQLNQFTEVVVTQVFEASYNSEHQIQLLDESTPSPYRTAKVIQTNSSGQRRKVFTSLFSLLLIEGVISSEIPEKTLNKLWISSIEHFSHATYDDRAVCAQLWSMLLKLDLANRAVCQLMISKLLKMEVVMTGEKSADQEERNAYLEQHMDCFEIVSELLPKFDYTNSFSNLDVATVAGWGTEAVTQIVKNKATRLETFARSICDLLCSVLPGTPHDSALLKDMKDYVQKLVNELLLRYEEDDIVERLQPFISFLLTVDEATGSEEEKLKLSCDQQVAKLPQSKQRLASLKLTRIVVAALVRSGQPTAKRLRERLVPSDEQFVKMAEEAVLGNNSPVLLTLLSLIGDLSSWSCIQPSTAVALLSFPFLSGHQTDNSLFNGCKRHSSKIPLLMKLAKHANKWNMNVAEARYSCIVPLVKIKGFGEWRRSVMCAAMNDQNPEVRKRALENLPGLLKSIEFNSFSRTIGIAFEAARGDEEQDRMMLWVARSICAEATRSDLGEDSRCPMCSGDSESVEPTSDRNKESPANLTRNLLNALNTHNPGIGCCALLCSTAFHLPQEMSAELAERSLVLIENRREDVRLQYLVALKPIISRHPLDDLEDVIKTKLKTYGAASQEVDPYLIKLYSLCAKYGSSFTLRFWSFTNYYSIVLQTGPVFANSFRTLMQELAAAEKTGCANIFARHVRAVTRLMYDHLLSLARNADEMMDDFSNGEEIADALELARKTFKFEDVASMLKICATYLIPLLESSNEKQLAAPIIQLIRSNLSEKDVSKIDTKVIPITLMNYVCSLPEGHLPDPAMLERIIARSLLNVNNSCRYTCNQQLLQCLAVSERAVFKALRHFNKQELLGNQNHASILMHIMQHRCEYVGHFLRFRTSLTQDEYNERRPILLKSFHIIIGMLEEEFLDKVSNRVMTVLRAATTTGRNAIPLWVQFARRLSSKVLGQLLPRILLDIQPLLKYEESRELFEVIFNEQATRDVDRESFVSTAVILSGTDEGMERMRPYIGNRLIMHAKGDKLINCGIRLLSEESETVGKVVLEKLFSNMDTVLEDDIISKLVPVLLQTLRRCGDPNTRLLVVSCLGRIGAVDPGRLSASSADADRSSEAIVFVDSKDFFVHLLQRSWQAYCRETDSIMSESIEYCIQEILGRVVAQRDELKIMERLSMECRMEIEPLRNTNLEPEIEPQLSAQSPIVDHVDSFAVWLQQCFVLGANKVRQDPMKYVFKALKLMSKTRDTLFTTYILSQLIIRLLIENDSVLEQYQIEMEVVLRRVLEGGASWVQLAAHIVFSIMDTLEQYVLHRKSLKKNHDQELKRTEGLLNKLVFETTCDGQLLIVAAAEKCNCFFRALKWCEQYAIKEGKEYDRKAFFNLENIYMKLQNVDGVLGAYECLSMNGSSSAAEKILALEANGDYHEAMAIYALDNRNEPEMVNCLLRLNQPQLALGTAKSAYERYQSDENICDILHANQIEATSFLREWHQVERLVEKRDPLNLGCRAPWGASCAAILCAAKRDETNVMNRRLLTARETLIDQLTAMTIEHSDTYTQAYNYITQLQILDEIETAATPGRGDSKRILTAATSRWKSRSERSIQFAASLEPVLRVRRELLRMFTDEEGVSEQISQLLIQSCRLARQAGHLQIAWTFLVEAHSLNVSHKEVCMEQARFEFQKGDQQQAISMLTKLLHGKFKPMTHMFVNQFVPFCEDQRWGSNQILKTPREERASFAEVQLLRAEYMMKAGAVRSTDLYKIYMALRMLEVPSEDLFYRIALFCDGMYNLDTANVVRSDLVLTIIKTYASALRYGRSHLFHAMPRILTLWLDFTQKKTNNPDRMVNGKMNPLEPRDTREIDKMNTEMLAMHKQLDPYYFYTTFQQLISRIVHPNEEVFTTLKTILVDLLLKYPHQCLWQSIGVYRSGKWGKEQRQIRCTQVYEVAARKNSRMQNLIDQYDYISSLFIKLADDKVSYAGSFDDLPKKYPALYDFFAHGTMDRKLLMGAHERKLSGTQKVHPTIMVPLTEMMNHALPREHKQKVESFSQIMIDTSSPEEQAIGSLPEVLIHSVDKSFLILKSLMRPKRLTLRGADGRTFQIMCKPGDEMRKDARFMDVNNMMNSLMRQNPEARRRQLNVKTFTVIPLELKGGILEWVPNLNSYRHSLQELIDTMAPKPLTDQEWFSNWDKSWPVEKKVRQMQQFFYPHHPLVMAEWFRRHFPDPSSWYAARSNYAKSAAVMSMIGFILGLGDRHGENILIDQKEGCVVHVDFNLIFNKGEELPVKEVVPFRLTRNMINGLGPTGVEGTFRKSCEATLKVMRDSKDTLLTVIQTFVHDPLLEWQDSSRAQQRRRDRNGQGPQILPQDVAADAVGLIGKRLEGHIVTPDVYRSRVMGAPPMSLEGQVDKLIEIATDEKHLAQMFIGWAPFF